MSPEVSTRSPCTGVCTTIQDRDVCRGCGRTLGEIAAWRSMSDTEKQAAVTNAETRLRWFQGVEEIKR